jgi:NitT/TauT family transport system substrate-binding protein
MTGQDATSRPRLLAFALAAIVTSGCGAGANQATPSPGQPPSSPASTASTAAVPKAPAAARSSARVKLTVSYSNPIGTYLPLWMAKESGIFERNGLDVDLQLIDSSKGIPALLSGQVQVSNLGGAETLSAAAGGADLVVVSEEAPVYPNVFQVPAEIKTLDELKGKKVGVSNIGSGSDVATRLGLQKVGIDPDRDVTIVAVGSLTNRVAAMQSGAIQGGIASPPDSLLLESKGFHTLFDFADLAFPAAVANDVFQRSFAADHKDAVQKYVDSLVQGIALTRKDKASAVRVLEKYLKSDDAAAMDKTYTYYATKVIPQLPYPKAEQYTDTQANLAKQNDKLRGFDVSKILDDSFVKSSAARGLEAS